MNTGLRSKPMTELTAETKVWD